ncbi:RNA-directed DNA polymerase, eukaryota, reverse transcriptase zinc-binding domain protein [Tanacetum coccineum]
MVDGNWIENPNDVKKEFFDHFASRFGKPDKPTASISLDFPNQISHEQSDHMEREVSNDEIKKSVWECGTDKAPGPDGFTFGFFRHFWHLVDRDVCEAVRYFFKFSDLPKGCNSSFIALIPKIPDANLVKDFRPISLIGSIYKIIAKILTNRLVDVLGGIINEVQSAFIKDRQILDGPFILNEVMSWCKKKKKQTLLFKVDFEKAYDRKEGFLDDVLGKFRLEERELTAFVPEEETWEWPFRLFWDVCGVMGASLRIDSLERGLELTQVEELAKVINPVVLTQSPDSWSWTLNNSGGYTVASSRNMIDSRLLPKGDLKTRRGIDIESLSCVNCDVGIETNDHLFFACNTAKKISKLINRWWDVPFMDINSYGEWRSKNAEEE